MFTRGTQSAIRTSQKRLTIVVAALGLLGSLILGLIWWDSVENVTAYSTQKRSIYILCSSVHYTSVSLMSLGLDEPYLRAKSEFYDDVDSPLFPPPEISHGQISIPIYLLILSYLASLLLIWVIQMNRLARRGSLWRRGLHPLSGGSGNRSSNERA